ncbi:MAG: hypothetical protein ABSE20_20340 [Acetobacteraceae bacterium]|jgi:hypothetical protein
MSLNTLPSARPYHPTTFQERGVALPFTTPLLGGARARLSRNRGIELIVRNPAGGRGVYVMPLNAVTSLCRPTLYDKVVSNRIAFLETVTPATVRAIGRATAAEGLAGEGAMQAARAAAKTEEGDRRVVVRHLLSSLIRQVNPGPNASSPVPGPGSPDLDARARQTIAWLAPRLGQSAGWGVKALDALADAITGLGIGDSGRIPGIIKLLDAMREEIAEWANTQRDGDRVLFAHTVCSVCDFTRSAAATMTTQTRMLTGDMVRLLRQWATDPDSVVRVAERPEWVLDGWEQICLIWNYAQDNAARRVALVEIADHIPVIPKELNEWGGGRANMDDVFAEQVHIGLNEDWRTGASVFDLIARNEQLRAAAS